MKKHFYIYTFLIPGKKPAWEVLKNTFPAPEKCLYTIFWHGEVLIHVCTYLAPERPEKPEKPEKYLYTPLSVYAWTTSPCFINRLDDSVGSVATCALYAPFIVAYWSVCHSSYSNSKTSRLSALR